jgi:peptidyl-prolyl cis-trans isomerase SurA
MIRAVFLLLCGLIFASAPAQTSKPTSKAPTLFTVNGKDVSAAEFIYLYKKNHQNAEQDYTAEKIQEYLDLYVNFKLKVEEARQRGMDATPAFKKEFNQYKEELRKPYLPGNNLTDSLVKITYDRLKNEVRASHILVAVSNEALPADTLKAHQKITAIRSRVVERNENFETVAAEVSEDPSAKMNRGDLGYFTALQMVYPFENAAFSTEVGQVSEILRTRFGYHILKVNDKRPARGEVEVSHIMIRTGEDKSADQAKAVIFEVFEKLQGGMKWDDLCKQYSEDPSSKDTGGRLRPFGVGIMASIPEFERVAFELDSAGQYSDPVQTQYGWHILRLERKIPLASFEELNTTLRSKVARDERSQISKQKLQAKLKNELRFSENATVKEKFLALADTSLQKGTWNRRLVVPSGQTNALFTIQGKPVYPDDFTAYVKEHQQPNKQSPQRYLQQLYDAFVDQRILDAQEEKIAAANPEYKFLLNEYYEGILLFEIMEKEVWNKASDDSVGQHAYYQANKQKYTAGERVKATLYSSSTPGVMEELKPMVANGDEKAIHQFVTAQKIKSEAGFFKKDDKALLKLVPWSVGVHWAENNGMYYLAWIKELLPAGNMSFEEARPSLISDYQNHLEESWLQALRKKYPVKLSKKGKSYCFSQLQKK